MRRYVEQHFVGHSLQLADAFLGATAMTSGFPLLTGNDQHYRVLKDLKMKKIVP